MDKQFAYQQRALTPTSMWLLFLFLGWSNGEDGETNLLLPYDWWYWNVGYI